ncbi:MAG: PTS sugar transporter subunit IIA [Candidatus Izemoplasmataceae bacterium]
MAEWNYYYESLEHLDNVDEALNVTLRRPLENGDVKSLYLKHVIDEIAESGRYMAITTDVLFLHTRDHESVNVPFISYVHLSKPMPFYDKAIRHIFAFGSFDDAMHRRMLAGLSHYISDMREDAALKDETAMKTWFQKHR